MSTVKYVLLSVWMERRAGSRRTPFLLNDSGVFWYVRFSTIINARRHTVHADHNACISITYSYFTLE